MSKLEILDTHFDMDGIIAPTEPLHVEAEIQTCIENGFKIDRSDWLGFKGRTAEAIFTYLIANYGDPNKHKVNVLIAQKTDKFIELASTELEPIPGVIKFLHEERERRKTVNLVTSSNSMVKDFILEKFGILDLFDHVVTGSDIANGKPHPEPYQKAIAMAGGRPNTSLAVEDSLNGIRSAMIAGCVTLAIPTSHPVEELRPTGAIVARDYPTARVYLDFLEGRLRR